MKCVVSGSTGLVGKSLINILSKNNEVIALTRREYKFPENVKQLLVDYDDEFIVPKADHLFICLGYPLKLLELIKMNLIECLQSKSMSVIYIKSKQQLENKEEVIYEQ